MKNDPLAADFRNFLFLIWQHLNLPEPTTAQYEIASFIHNGYPEGYDPKIGRADIVRAFRGVGKFESQWVFQSKRVQNPPLTPLHLIQKAIDKVGLNDDERLVKKKGKFTPHSLRDSYASILIQSGEVALYDLQEILGHTTPQMTQKYAHLIPAEAGRKAKAVLERDGLFSRAS